MDIRGLVTSEENIEVAGTVTGNKLKFSRSENFISKIAKTLCEHLIEIYNYKALNHMPFGEYVN